MICLFLSVLRPVYFCGLPMPPIGVIAAVHNNLRSFIGRRRKEEWGSQERQIRDRGEKRGMIMSDRMRGGERTERNKERKKERKPVGETDWDRRKWGGKRRGRRDREGRQEDLMNVDHCPST